MKKILIVLLLSSLTITLFSENWGEDKIESLESEIVSIQVNESGYYLITIDKENASVVVTTNNKTLSNATIKYGIVQTKSKEIYTNALAALLAKKKVKIFIKDNGEYGYNYINSLIINR